MHNRNTHHAHGPRHYGPGGHICRFARAERHHGDNQPHGRHGRGGRHGSPDLDLRRFFAHGDLRLVILRLIGDKPRHGYEIIKEIEERVAGAYSPSPGVIYPTLTLLEELGYVTVAAGEGGRKSHAITDAGRSFLTANAPAVEALFARMAAASQARADGPSPRIGLAMANLQHTLHRRLGRGPLNEEQAAAISTALDTAAAVVDQT